MRNGTDPGPTTVDETTELELPRIADPTRSDAIEEELLRRIGGSGTIHELPEAGANVARLLHQNDDLEKRNRALVEERIKLEVALREVRADNGGERAHAGNKAMDSRLRPEDAQRRAEAAERALAMAQDEIEQLNHRICLLEIGDKDPGSTSDSHRSPESEEVLRARFSERERELQRREDQARGLRDELARRGAELASAELRHAEYEARIRELELRLAEAAPPLTDAIPLTEIDQASGPIGFDGGPDDLAVSMDVAPHADPTEPYDAEASRPVTASQPAAPPPAAAAPDLAQTVASRLAESRSVEAHVDECENATNVDSADVASVPPCDGHGHGDGDGDDGHGSEDDADLPAIPGFALERVVERTAAGIAYLAREESTRKPVVVRVLPGADDARRRRRLDSMTHARHPNLFNALSSGVCAAGSFLVSERAGGETAQSWLDRVGALPEHSAVAVVLQAARGLRQAAFHGVVHADLGPAALRIDASGRVRVEGVGLASLDPSAVNLPRDVRHAAPERLRGSPPPDARTDIYALAAVLYTLLAGLPPFTGDAAAVLRAQTAAPFPDVRAVRPEISTATAQMIAKMADRDPDRRPADWDQALLALERRAGGTSAGGGDPAERVVAWLREHPAALAALVAVPILLIALLALLF